MDLLAVGLNILADKEIGLLQGNTKPDIISILPYETTVICYDQVSHVSNKAL